MAVRRLALIVVVLAVILVPFAVAGDGMDRWVAGILRAPADHPAAAALLLGLLLAADVLLPVPSSLVSTSLGALLGGPAGTIVSTVGMTAACWVGYQLGRGAGRPVARRLIGGHDLTRLTATSASWGGGAVLLLRAVPGLAEASTIAAGLGGMSRRRFLLLVACSNAVISAVYATTGAYAVTTRSFLLAFAGAVLVPALALGAARMIRRRA
ncbi:hypothetical protein ACTI_85510 [Actinoplanes sp. OR16]|nr:hypothetical protein ACTI_85510 [Actinoplanes sp. OR16]